MAIGCTKGWKFPIFKAMDPITTDLLAAQNESTRFAISMKVLSKAKSVQEQQGEAVVEMIAAAAETGKNVRTKSGGVDTYA